MARVEFCWEVQSYRAQGLGDEQIAERMGLRADTFARRLAAVAEMNGQAR